MATQMCLSDFLCTLSAACADIRYVISYSEEIMKMDNLPKDDLFCIREKRDASEKILRKYEDILNDNLFKEDFEEEIIKAATEFFDTMGCIEDFREELNEYLLRFGDGPQIYGHVAMFFEPLPI